MSFWDNMKKITQPYSDDEYDDYDDEYMDDYDEEENSRPRRSAPAPRAEETHEDYDNNSNGNNGGNYNASSAASSAAPSATASPAGNGGFNGQVLNMRTPKQEVVLFRPTNYNDSSKAADDLRNRKAVIINLENVDKAVSRRVIDFMSGCAYALEGSVKKVAQYAYLFCPHNMVVTGDLEALQAEVESYINTQENL